MTETEPEFEPDTEPDGTDGISEEDAVEVLEEEPHPVEEYVDSERREDLDEEQS